MKKNELVPVGNGESFTRCGWIRLALKTLFEDPHASFFVETIPLCVQLNLIASIYCRFPDLTVSPCMTCSLINSKSDLAPCYAALLQIGPS